MFYNEWQKEVSPLPPPLLLIDSVIALMVTATAIVANGTPSVVFMTTASVTFTTLASASLTASTLTVGWHTSPPQRQRRWRTPQLRQRRWPPSVIKPSEKYTKGEARNIRRGPHPFSLGINPTHNIVANAIRP